MDGSSQQEDSGTRGVREFTCGPSAGQEMGFDHTLCRSKERGDPKDTSVTVVLSLGAFYGDSTV